MILSLRPRPAHRRSRACLDRTRIFMHERAAVGDPAADKRIHRSAEQALLGALLIDNSAFTQASASVESSHFSYTVHGRIFAAIGTMIERGEVAF